MTSPEQYVRGDGIEKVTGQARYAADLVLPGLAQAKFLWARRAHARIVRLDTAEAEALPGVFAVVTAKDVPDVRYGSFVKDRHLFAREIVRFAGEPVAMVAALTEEIAAEAVALIDVEFDDLPAVLDPELALDPDSTLVHPDWATYDAFDEVVRDRNDSARATTVKGDADRALAGCEIVVRGRYVADVSHAVPIEPHAILAQWEGAKVTVWSTSQVPFGARSGIAETLQLLESQVRVVVPHLGGGFGGKCEFHFEAHVAALARKARRPVRLVFDREEEFLAPDKTRHGMIIELETGLDRDGAMVARRARIVLDSGAYASDSAPLTEIATMLAVGPYRIPHVAVEAFTPYTNKTPSGSVRAPTGPQMCWAVEQHTDELAQRAGLSPYEFRLKNLVDEGDEGPTGQVYEPIGARRCLERAAALIGEGPVGDGEAVGLACGMWFSMPAPSGAYMKLNADGSGVIITGAQESGTGAVMALPLLAAEELGMRPESFKLVYQDTDAGPWDAGSSGSQTTFNNGRAVVAAAREIRRKLLDLASEELEIDASDLELGDGRVYVKGSPHRGSTIAELAERAHGSSLLLATGSGDPPDLPANNATGCVGRIAFGAFAAPTFFAHAARIRLDGETGVVRVLDYAAVHDFGYVINPVGAQGQVEGGVVHGLGIALTEGAQLAGGIQQNPRLLDYKLSTSADAPPIQVEFVDAPDPNGGPHGSKGVGEPPVIGPAAAIATALAAVTGRPMRRLPMTSERVWEAMTGRDGDE